jgi:hypothetical protein
MVYPPVLRHGPPARPFSSGSCSVMHPVFLDPVRDTANIQTPPRWGTRVAASPQRASVWMLMSPPAPDEPVIIIRVIITSIIITSWSIGRGELSLYRHLHSSVITLALDHPHKKKPTWRCPPRLLHRLADRGTGVGHLEGTVGVAAEGAARVSLTCVSRQSVGATYYPWQCVCVTATWHNQSVSQCADRMQHIWAGLLLFLYLLG